MMTYKIHNDKYHDTITVTGKNIDDVCEKAVKIMNRLGWDENDCRSERITANE